MKRTRLLTILLAALMLLSACAQNTPETPAPQTDPAPVVDPAPAQTEPTPAQPEPVQVTADNFYAALEGEWRCVGGETEGWAYTAEEAFVSGRLSFAPEGCVTYSYTDSAGNDDGAVIRPEDVRFVDEPYFDCSDWYVELTDHLMDARILDVGPDGERLVFSDPEAMGVLFFERVPGETLLTVDYCDSREAAEAYKPRMFVQPEWYDYDEPGRQWAVVTALRDGTAVTFERTLAEAGASELYLMDGVFVPMNVYAELSLDAGECVAFEVVQAWYPRLRVTASRGGLFGDYAFGSDNFFHLDNATRYVVGTATPNGAPASEHELRERLAGSWAFGENGSYPCEITFRYDGTCFVNTDEQSFALRYELDRLYAADDEAPDLLRFSTDDEHTLDVLPDYFAANDGLLGDYLIDLAQCGNETLLLLTQANNGDAALQFLIPHEGSDYTFLLCRSEGASDAVPTHKGESFPATVWRYDPAHELMWVQALTAADEDEAGYTLYRAAPAALAEPYRVRGDAAELLSYESDPCYPAAHYEVTIDADGYLTALD